MVLRGKAWVLVLLLACSFVLCACAASPEATSSDAVLTVQGEQGAQSVAKRVENGDSDESSAVATHATLRYLGQASLRIVTPEGKVIYVDPYAGKTDDYSLPADLILVTHDHFDHCAVDKVRNRSVGCEIITHVDAVKDGRHPTFDLAYVTVVPVQAGFNPLHDVNACVGYVLKLSDGTSVYASGDTSTTDDMRNGTLAAMQLDYAFWCCDGVYNMGQDEAAEAAAMVGAKHNIAYHNSTSNSGEMFDRPTAERFAAPNAMVVYPGQDIELS